MNIRFYPTPGVNKKGQRITHKWQSHNYGFLIKAMNAKKQTPISYADAMELFSKEFARLSDLGLYKESVEHLQSDKIDYLSSIGYHIEFTGDEWFTLEEISA